MPAVSAWARKRPRAVAIDILDSMARYTIPPHVKHVRVCVAQGGAFAVWNGRTGRDEFRIVRVRKREQAERIARQINAGKHGGVVEVFS